MATLQQRIAVRNDEAFNDVVSLAMLYIANEVIREDPSTVGYTQRYQYAKRIMTNVDQYRETVKGFLVLNDTVVDAAIAAGWPPANQTLENQLINALLGAIRASWNILSGTL